MITDDHHLETQARLFMLAGAVRELELEPFLRRMKQASAAKAFIAPQLSEYAESVVRVTEAAIAFQKAVKDSCEFIEQGVS